MDDPSVPIDIDTDAPTPPYEGRRAEGDEEQEAYKDSAGNGGATAPDGERDVEAP